MRGTVFIWIFSGETGRITPAHAGNSCLDGVLRGVCGDHPRTCGEQLASVLVGLNKGGSPPHMRGTAFFVSPEYSFLRITPAHAGNSLGCGTSHRGH